MIESATARCMLPGRTASAPCWPWADEPD